MKHFFIILFLLNTATASAYGEHDNKLTDAINLERAKFSYVKGMNFGKSGILDSALFYTNQAINICEHIQNTDSTLLANAYQSLGIIYKLSGKYDEAIACYDKSEKIYQLNNNQSLLAFIYSNKANIYYIHQDYPRAKEYYIRALKIFNLDSLKYIDQLAITNNNFGNFYKKYNDFINAITYYKRSLFLKNNQASHKTTLSNLAYCYEQIKEYQKAEEYYLQAIDIIKQNYGENNIWFAYNQMIYGNFISNRSASNKKALRYFNNALSIYKNNIGNKHPELSECYNYLGEYYLKNHNTDSALYCFQQSLIALSPDFNDTSLNSNPGLNNVFSKIHLLSSLKNKASALTEKASQDNDVLYYRLSLATYDLATGTINKIRSGYLSEESKLFLANNEFETFSNALQTSYELYKLTHEKEFLEKVFKYSEAGKSAILTEAVKNIQALNIGGIPDSLINKEKLLEKNIWGLEELIYEENKIKNPDQIKLGYWNNSLFEKKRELDDLNNYLEENFPKYYTLKNTQNTLEIEELQQKLSHKNVLIEYFIAHDKIYTIVISKTKTDIIELNADSTFYENLDKLLSALSNNNFSNHGFQEFKQYQESSFYIYNQLLKPIENTIKNKDLIIIPDGKLAYLPFEVLTTHNVDFDRINYKALPYLLYQNNFNYAYSASFVFSQNKAKQTAYKKLGAFAPAYNNTSGLPEGFSAFRQEYRERLFPLKGIKDEVQNISELIDGDIYLDDMANEKDFKLVAPFYDILHLAMHTIMDDQNPMYSKMAFTQIEDSTEDGFLNTYELYNMRLNSRMAVLSSCNSGSGKMQRGEGVMSMARGFIYAGCPSIVMTLWSVEDRSGVKLMTSFYENLLKGKTKSESLKLSKINFIKTADQLKAHPYFWSGYVVIGNNDALFTSYKNCIAFSIIALLLISGIIWGIRFRKKSY